MSEDIQGIEADLEALMAALELAGVMADRARREALRLAERFSTDAPQSRRQWEDRAQLRDGQGEPVGWLDTKDARRIDLTDPSGAGDRGIAAEPQRTGVAGERLLEIEGQFFEVTAGKGRGALEQVRAITGEQAQEAIESRRPDLSTRFVGEQDPRLEIRRLGQGPTAETGAPAALGEVKRPERDRSGEVETPGAPSAAEVFASAQRPSEATASR